MQILQNVARSYGLVCLLHEKPFAGVNGSGKHNNWSMGTDTGTNLLEPGETPEENLSFLFFCAAVIKAVNKHQGLLRASVASIGQDHRLGANEAPPAIISIFLGADLEKVFEAISTGEGDPHTPGSFLGLGTVGTAPATDARRRSQPDLAVCVYGQQVRVPGGRLERLARLPEYGPQHDRRGGHRRARGRGRDQADGDGTEAVPPSSIVRESYRANQLSSSAATTTPRSGTPRREQRGLENLRTTPDALPEVSSQQTIETSRQVLGALRARTGVALRGVGRAVRDEANIEAETTASIGGRCSCRRRFATSR